MKSSDASGCKIIINKVYLMGSCIVVMQDPDLFRILVAFGKCVNVAFQAHSDSIPSLQ